MVSQKVTIDGNEAAAYVAHKTNEVIAIYPITPASPMGELADQWSAVGVKNIWGSVPDVIELQSEAGAAGSAHGSLQAGALTTTFTASQGLLLMLPNMYKIAGELLPTVFHISARTVATQALSIFGDHSDVMAARATGWAMLFSNSVQEVMDFALIAQTATLLSRVPFLHVFDGFRTSHEVQKIEQLSDEVIRAMTPEDAIRDFRNRAMTPDRPILRGTAQNPDTFFQAREAINPYYAVVPGIVQDVMDRFAGLVGRQYKLFGYTGAPDAERVIVMMGSGCEAAEETVEYLAAQGEKVGLVKVRLFRPFSVRHFLNALPKSVRVIAVLDRTKEPGSAGEPLYQDVLTALHEGGDINNGLNNRKPINVIGGRYGLSSKEFTPAMVKGVFDEMKRETPKNHFTVGIKDDVSHKSVDYDPSFDIEPDEVTRAVFWGLGSDGTVGANKNSIKIIGEETDFFAQGYFVYDSKKAGARTISHLRFGPRPIQSTYQISRANFVACHQFGFLEQYDILDAAVEGATFLLNSPYGPDEVWDKLPRSVQEQIVNKKLRFYVIDAYSVAREVGLGVRINTIMQTAFFALSGVLPREEAIEKIKNAIKKTYGRRGEAVVRMNYEAVDGTLANLYEVKVPGVVTSRIERPPVVPAEAPSFVREVLAPMIAGRGDDLPVSAFPSDGTYPTGTTQWEKRNIAQEIPVWDPEICIQCGKCVMVCPHASIRAKVVSDRDLVGKPDSFLVSDASWRELPGMKYVLAVAPEDCTGCKLCVEICPAKSKSDVSHKALNMEPQLPIRERERVNWDFFLSLPDFPRTGSNGNEPLLKFTKVKDVQLLQPLFEFSSACAGCGETPYLRLLSQLFGDRAIMANATGCSSIYGGNLPTTPWTKNREGRGPTWNNSLFEDAAEFGLGMRLAIDKQRQYGLELVERLREWIGDDLAEAIIHADQTTETGIEEQRKRVEQLRRRIGEYTLPEARDLEAVLDSLVSKSVWIIGGDGWAYDIGYGGLDHVLATGRNVNLLVLDTEVYSNTGGQASKATGLGASAKFAAGGKPTPKKDLARMAMSYGYVYVAQVALGANDNQAIKAFLEAESYDGPSIIIAYCQCIAHGIDMAKGMHQQELAVDSGYWPLFRFDPRRKAENKPPLQLDSRPPKIPLEDYIYNENRYRLVRATNPEVAAQFLKKAQEAVNEKWRAYERMASAGGDGAAGPAPAPPKSPKEMLPGKLPPAKVPGVPVRPAGPPKNGNRPPQK